MMKRLFFSMMRLMAVLALPVAIGLSSQAYAADVFPVCGGNASNTEVCQEIPNHGTPGENPIIKVLRISISVLSIIIGVVAVIMLIVAGLSFITANGDAQAAGRARSSIIYALVGLIIAGLAQALVTLVLSRL